MMLVITLCTVCGVVYYVGVFVYFIVDCVICCVLIVCCVEYFYIILYVVCIVFGAVHCGALLCILV